jgi:lipopolysaccharide transport system ATP-binding protein
MVAAIRVEGLGKCYCVRQGQELTRYRTLRESLSSLVRSPFGGRGKGEERDEFWALKDVSFEVQPGEVVGIIGRNGAGKSTLLKILSRITKPTTGRVHLNGRVGSLLEVGTGFHPELTGRENIYLNGSILGMSRKEIDRRFDEIVAFAEVERFLDTPVKRYSSGMYVRLAFAVAAHLQPEILIVDEVLAVGDAAFQKKCLGKMQDVAKHGRTICFVSHNMPAVLQICRRAIVVRQGEIIFDGSAQEATDYYLGEGRERQSEVCSFEAKGRPDWVNHRATLLSCRMRNEDRCWSMPYGGEIALEISVQVKKPLDYLELGLALCTATGFEIASSLSCDSLPLTPTAPGRYTASVSFPSLTLAPGQYFFGLGLRSEHGMEDYLAEAVWFEVLPTEESSDRRVHRRKGVVIPNVHCKMFGECQPGR